VQVYDVTPRHEQHGSIKSHLNVWAEINTSFVRTLPAYRTKADQKVAQVFFPNGDIPSLSRNCYSVSFIQNYGKPTPESRKVVNQSRFEMTSDECTSRERSKREENRTKNKRRKGRDQNRRKQISTDEKREYESIQMRKCKRREETKRDDTGREKEIKDTGRGDIYCLYLKLYLFCNRPRAPAP
jgi:hypothetical protein